jgi:hypothetical protein
MDTVTVSYLSPNETWKRLIKEGWCDLQFVSHNSFGDATAPEIMGKRPMTQQEIKKQQRRVKNFEISELAELAKMAKKHGLKLVKANPKKSKPKKRHGWEWACSAQNPRYGCFHADAEYCRAKSKKYYETKEEAEQAGNKHASKCYLSKQYGKTISVYRM